MNKDKKRWLLLATIGLILIGMGLCLVIDAAFFKQRDAATIHWVAYGTGALIVFNSGISIFGQAVVERIKLEKKANS